MATCTSVGTGAWGTAGTWDTGVPANGDTVIISDGHTVTFDADESGFAAGLASLTVNGTLIASTTAGAYYLKMAGHITGTGTIQAGTSAAVRYPANCSFTVDLAGAYSIDGPVCKFYCAAPTVENAQIVHGTGTKTVQAISKGAVCSVRCDGHGLTGSGTGLVLLNLGDTHPLNNLYIETQTITDSNNFTVRWRDNDVVIDSTNFPDFVSGTMSPSTATGTTDTTLYLDRDVSSWGTGVEVALANVNRPNTALNKVLTINTNNGTNLVLSGQVGSAFQAGSGCALITRNIRVINSTRGTSGSIRNSHNGQFDCEIRGDAHGLLSCDNAVIAVGAICTTTARYGLVTCTGVTISGGVLQGNSIGLSTCTGATISGGVLQGNSYGLNGCTSSTISGGVLQGNSNGLYACTGATISGGVLQGNSIGLGTCTGVTISGGVLQGNSNGLHTCTGATISGGVLQGNSNGLSTCTGSFANIVFDGNMRDFYRCSGSTARNCLMGSSVENYLYNSEYIATNYLDSFDHDQVAGAFRSWTAGGITDKVTDVKPDGKAFAYQHTCESATYPCYRNEIINVEPGDTLRVLCWLRKNAAMTIKPKVEILDFYDDPLADPTFTAMDSFTMTDSVDTWETDTLSWTNSAAYRRQVLVRATAQDATGIAWEYVEVDANYIRASSFENCEAGNIKSGVVIDDVTGIYEAEPDPDTVITAAGGNYVEPEADELLKNVVCGAGEYEVVGQYVPIADSDTVDGGVEFGVGEEGTGVNAESILTALGLATGNLDTQLAAIKTETAEIVEDTAAMDSNLTKVKAAVYDSAPMGNDGYIVLSNGTRVLVSAAGRAITES